MAQYYFFFFLHCIQPTVSLKPVGPVDSCHDKAIKKYRPEKLQPRGRHSSFYSELHGNWYVSVRDIKGNEGYKNSALVCNFLQ